MSFQTNSESMFRYPEQMQHDEILTEQDQKYISDFFDTLATDEPPSHMMDITQHSASNIPFPANNSYLHSNYQQIHAHNNFAQQYPQTHQISSLSNGGMNVGKGKSTNSHTSALYVKTEPINISNRRQQSPSPSRLSSMQKQPLKRTPSRRKSIKNSNELSVTSTETKSDEGNNSSSTTHQSTSFTSGINDEPSTPGSPKIMSTSDSNNAQSSTPTSNRGGRGKKGNHELLTEAEKKANHIASEQKRRQNIRLGFDQLVEIVPTLSQCHRSEALILQKCNIMLFLEE
ncbi:9302_t:CDS:2 [Acaulospora colombiana]|uniref:9302_t:CDS:1 n=1 Tax=Acaulospora colombiana TaxID=27376 RepID=A0ACA9LYP7_9GLOM|nr:9302_t:CDS:2 [Acaulospora colombiana]